MPEAWRIVKAKRVAPAFSGEGAAKFGGRWNSQGMLVVYTSSTQALATLETLVHLNPPVHFNFKAIRIEFGDEIIERAAFSKLPSDWRSQPPPPSTKKFGDAWIISGRTAVLAMPSVIVPGEVNYLLNPSHPDFKKIKTSPPIDFTLDPRLLPQS